MARGHRRWVPCRTRTAAAWPGSDASSPPERRQWLAHRRAPRQSAGVREAEHTYVNQNRSYAKRYNNDSNANRSNAPAGFLPGAFNPRQVGAWLEMLFGHNTNVQAGDTTYHVQTEDRGTPTAPTHTTAYFRHQLLPPPTNSYLT